MNETATMPFQIKEGEFYSIFKGDVVVGVFLSNGVAEHFPNGDADGNILYKMHACLFNNGSLINPPLLCVPNISKHRGLVYPREFGIRYADEKEKRALLNKMKRKGYVWNIYKNEVEKLNRK